MDIALNVKEADDHLVLVVEGELDLATAPRFRDVIVDLLSRSREVVIDLQGVTFLDSTGLGVLAGGLKRARGAGGDLRLSNVSAPVRRVLELTRLDQAFTIEG